MFSGVTRFIQERVLPELEALLSGFFSDLFHEILVGGGAVLTNAASEAVAAAEATGGSGSLKFAAAVASVKGVLTAQGIPLVENAVQGAVIAAVAKLNAAKAAPAA